MSEFKESIFNKLVNIMADNPDLFPIVRALIESHGEDKERQEWLKFEIKNFIGLQTVYSHYFDRLNTFWFESENDFKDKFPKLLITKVLIQYTGIFTSKKKEQQFRELIDKL